MGLRPHLLLIALFLPCRAFAQAEGAPAGGPVVAPRPAGSPVVSSETYQLSPGDIIYVSVEGEELLTRECQVNGAGTISYPMLGDVPVAGLTSAGLQAALQEGLQKYLRHPQVLVTVRQYGQSGTTVFVMGEVKSPGAYPLASASGLMQALAAAGGLTETAAAQVTILSSRTGLSRVVPLSEVTGGSAGALLQPGDVILVQRKREARYSVLGEVPKPGMFDMPLQGEARILDAMEKAGLLTPNPDAQANRYRSILDDPTRIADLERAQLTRGDAVMPVNLVALLQGDTSHNLVLQSGDVLTVPRLPIVRVYALGEIRTPGRHNLPVDATVLDLMSASGGLTTAARPARATVVRLVEGKPTSLPVDLGRLLGQGDLRQNVVLQEGDVLFVPPKGDSSATTWRILSLIPYLAAL